MQSGSPRAGAVGIASAVLLYIGVIYGLSALDSWLDGPEPGAAATAPTPTAPPPVAPPVDPPAAVSGGATTDAAPPDDAVRQLTLTVALDTPGREAREGARPAIMNVSRFWPDPDEAALPERAITEVLEEVLALEQDEETALLPAATAELMTLAAAEGLGPLAGAPGEPWQALLILEVERRRSEAAWVSNRVDPGWRKTTADALALADAVAAANEHTLAGDLAELYALQALADSAAETYDAQRAVDAALNLLHFTEDYEVMQAAADLLSGVGEVPALEPQDVSLLRGVYKEVEDRRIRDGLGHLLLDQAVLSDDAALGAAMIDDLEALGSATCPEADDSHVCAGRLSTLAASEGLLAARAERTPKRWRAAMAAAAWRCHLDGAALVAPLTGEASWSGQGASGWTWEAWTGDGPFRACLTAATAGAPGPAEPATLTFTILPPIAE